MLSPRFRTALLGLLTLSAPALADPPDGFVYLRDVDAGIAQDMRYAGSDNFTGAALPGYDAAECVLTRAAAEALRQVEVDLAPRHLGLKVYDCYRPTRAVAAFARWARAPEAPGAPTKRFYPALDKRRLFAEGYIAAHSAHSAGIAVDLTLIALPPARVATFDPAARYGPCTAPANERAPDNSLDFGTGFDCFDAKAHTSSEAIAPEQARRRALLVAAMRKRGFHNYPREWWHFSYGPHPRVLYDFPITPRASSTSP